MRKHKWKGEDGDCKSVRFMSDDTERIFFWKPMRGISQPAPSVPSISTLILSVIGFYQRNRNIGLRTSEHNSAAMLHAHTLPAHNNRHLSLVLIALLGLQSIYPEDPAYSYTWADVEVLSAHSLFFYFLLVL